MQFEEKLKKLEQRVANKKRTSVEPTTSDPAAKKNENFTETESSLTVTSTQAIVYSSMSSNLALLRERVREKYKDFREKS